MRHVPETTPFRNSRLKRMVMPSQYRVMARPFGLALFRSPFYPPSFISKFSVDDLQSTFPKMRRNDIAPKNKMELKFRAPSSNWGMISKNRRGGGGQLSYRLRSQLF